MIFKKLNETYLFWFHLALFEPIDKIEKHLNKQGWNIEIPSKTLDAAVIPWDDLRMCVIYFSSKKHITHGTIAHECHHAVMSMCKTLGIKPNVDNQEPTAYLHGWLAEWIYKILSSKKIKVLHE